MYIDVIFWCLYELYIKVWNYLFWGIEVLGEGSVFFGRMFVGIFFWGIYVFMLRIKLV